MRKKQFALEAITPYILDNSLCGYDSSAKRCLYATNDGRYCVAGKFMKPEFRSKITNTQQNIKRILEVYTQEEVFIPEAQYILVPEEWLWLQKQHDKFFLIDNPADPKFALYTDEELDNHIKSLS